MTNDVEKAADRVAELRAQIDKVSGPPASAEVQLRAAEEAETARRTAREVDYSRQFAQTWRDQADEAANSGDEARERFFEALAAEPWFAAHVEYRTARYN